MKNNNTSKIIAVIIILIIIIVLVVSHKKAAAPVAVENNPAVTNTTPADNTNSNPNNPNPSVQGTSNVMASYSDPKGEFSISYDPGFAIDTVAKQGMDWTVNSKYIGTTLLTITIPKSYMPNTNFDDAKLTLGKSSDQNAVRDCWMPGYAKSDSTISTINGVQFKKFTSSDAGAGNFYDTTSYHATIGNTCYAIEYTIHSSNIGNYPTDSGIKEFDKTTVQNQLEKIVQSLKLKK